MNRNNDHNISDLEGITGVILAGGKSSRYGTNKALAELRGVRLIERVIKVMGSIFGRLIIITNTPKDYAYLDLPMYPDLIEGVGPFGGIYTGLDAMQDQAGFFVACDMPFLNPSLISHIAGEGKKYDVVVPRTGWKIEPLHALYSKKCLPLIRESINDGVYQIIRIFDRVRVRYIDEQEIRAFDPCLRSFLNVNRPEELAEAAEGEE